MSRNPIQEPLESIVDRLVILGETEMGNLTFKQAAQFHKATQILQTLLEQVHRVSSL